MNKKSLSLLLIMIMIFTSINFPLSVNASSSMSVVGINSISGSELSGKEVFVSHFTATPDDGEISDFVGQINWSVVGNPEGVKLLTSAGLKNNEVDLVIYRDSFFENSIVLRATSPSHGTVDKTITITQNKVSQIRDFNIVPVFESKATALRKTGANSYESIFALSDNSHSVVMSYDVSIYDSSFPKEEVFNNLSASLQSPISGVSVSSSVNRFKIIIDREQVVSNSLNFGVILSGTTDNGVSFSKTINYTGSLEGIYGVNSNDYQFSIDTSNGETIHFVDPLNSYNINMSKKVKINGVDLSSSTDVDWTISSSDPAVSISSFGTVTVGIGAINSSPIVTATLVDNPSISESIQLEIITDNTTYGNQLNFSGNTKEATIKIPSSGDANISISSLLLQDNGVVSDKTIVYASNPSAGISFSGDDIVVSSSATSGKYVISSTLSDGTPLKSNEISLNLISNDIDPLKFYDAELKFNNLVVDIPYTGTPANVLPFNGSILENGINQGNPFSVSIVTNPSGISISGNSVRVLSDASQGFYTIKLESTEDPNIVEYRTIFVNDPKEDSSGWTIVSSAVNDDDGEIDIPADGVVNIVFEGKASYSGDFDPNQEIVYELSKSVTGVNLLNDTMIIDSTALDDSFNVIAKMKNSNTVINSMPFSIVGGEGSTANYSVQVRFDEGNSINLPPQDVDNVKLPFNIIVRNNGVLDNSKGVTNTIAPNLPNIYVENNHIVVTPNATPGTYTLRSELSEDSKINHSAVFEVVDPNANSGIKKVFMIAPNSIKIPYSGETKNNLDYNVTLNGTGIEKEDVYWELITEKDGVSLDSKGLLTIKSSTNASEIWIRVSLKSDLGVTAKKKITLTKEVVSGEVPHSVKLTGFKDDSKNVRTIEANNTSGNKFLLIGHTYDSSNSETFGSKVNVYLKKPVAGIRIEQGEYLNQYYLIANSVYTDKSFTVIVESVHSSSIKEEISVSLEKPEDFNVLMSFDKEYMAKKDNFGVTAVYANNTTKKKNVVLVVAMYRDKQLLDIQYKSVEVDKRKSETVRTKVVLPTDLTDVYVKAYFAEGQTAYTAGKILATPIRMNSK